MFSRMDVRFFSITISGKRGKDGHNVMSLVLIIIIIIKVGPIGFVK